MRISVVTPTLRRPDEVAGLLDNLAAQELLPGEAIVVDGAPAGEEESRLRAEARAASLPFRLRYLRQGGGTALQRNRGIEEARGDLVAFVDDDVRLEPGFFRRAAEIFSADGAKEIGGVVGYRVNQHFLPESRARWRWYRRLRLLRVFEPGRYDFECGYPVNANMQPPFEGVRPVDFMTTACAVWRREVFDAGLRFDPFFRDYGMLEDAHLSLRAGRRWRLLQSGGMRCRELHAPGGRPDRRRIGYKCVVNYYYLFREVAGPLTAGQRWRFWRFQAFELLRIAASALRRRRLGDLAELGGRLQGFWAVARGAWVARG